MISVTSTTEQYTLQPSLLEMHRQSLDWLSNSVLWKRELSFFQKLLDEHSVQFTAVDDKKKIDHFQNLIIYYQGELIDALRKKLRDHENHLAKVLQDHNESDTVYFKTHDAVIQEMIAFNKQFFEFKHDFFSFIEQALR
jgi:hypothetical protein